jgi:hypothetical protein
VSGARSLTAFQHPTPLADATPFSPVDMGGAIDTLYANAGIVNRRTDRSQEQSTPWNAAPPPVMLRKLTHFRAPGAGDAMWSGSCIYDVAGVTPSYSEYDETSSYAKDTGMSNSVKAGVVTRSEPVAPGEPSTSRRPRLAAHYDSAPAAAIFQGYWNPHWSGLLSGFRPQVMPRPLHSNFNPGQMGSKELHKATQYQPVPPLGSLVGYFGSSDKAL